VLATWRDGSWNGDAWTWAAAFTDFFFFELPQPQAMVEIMT